MTDDVAIDAQRWWVILWGDYIGPVAVTDEARAQEYRDAGWTATEVVPAEQVRGAIEEIDQERADVQRAIRADGLGAEMREIGFLEGLESALRVLRRGQS